MAVKIRRTSDYRQNESRCESDETPCAVCGKGVLRPWPHAILIGMGGGMAITKEESRRDRDDLGWWPVGRDCWRKHTELHPYCR